jgi:hypothetical protein
MRSTATTLQHLLCIITEQWNDKSVDKRTEWVFDGYETSYKYHYHDDKAYYRTKSEKLDKHFLLCLH